VFFFFFVKMLQFAITFVIVALSFSQGYKVEHELITKILKDYDIKVPPTLEPNKPVYMTCDISLVKLRNIDEVRGEADIGLFFSMAWNDSRLSWDPKDFKNIKKIAIPSTSVWIPDMMLYTGSAVVEKSLGPLPDFDVIVRSDGSVIHVPSVNQRMSCIYTTDKHGLQCGFSTDSWASTNDLLNVRPTKKIIETTDLGTYYDQNYKIKEAVTEYKEASYADAPDDKYDLIKGKIVLEKKK